MKNQLRKYKEDILNAVTNEIQQVIFVGRTPDILPIIDELRNKYEVLDIPFHAETEFPNKKNINVTYHHPQPNITKEDESFFPDNPKLVIS